MHLECSVTLGSWQGLPLGSEKQDGEGFLSLSLFFFFSVIPEINYPLFCHFQTLNGYQIILGLGCFCSFKEEHCLEAPKEYQSPVSQESVMSFLMMGFRNYPPLSFLQVLQYLR